MTEVVCISGAEELEVHTAAMIAKVFWSFLCLLFAATAVRDAIKRRAEGRSGPATGGT